MIHDHMDTREGSFLHPAAGALILGLDWLLFSGTAASGAVLLPLAMLLGFTLSGLGTCCIQHFWAKDPWRRAMSKGLLGGIVVGLPFPICGTLVGGAVLASSGLDQFRDRATRTLTPSGPGESPGHIEGK